MNGPSPHARRQVESAEHDREQVSTQRISQVLPLAQVTLPLGPTVIRHVEPMAQSTLHELPHVPLHSLWSPQSSEQLLPAQLEPSMSQAEPASQAHEVPVQVGGPASWPHAASTKAATTTRDRRTR